MAAGALPVPLLLPHTPTPPPTQVRGQGDSEEAKKICQLAEKVCQWLAFSNPTAPWASWATEVLVPRIKSTQTALQKKKTIRQAVIKTNKLAESAGERARWGGWGGERRGRRAGEGGRSCTAVC
jgi:hypothetical protein